MSEARILHTHRADQPEASGRISAITRLAVEFSTIGLRFLLKLVWVWRVVMRSASSESSTAQILHSHHSPDNPTESSMCCREDTARSGAHHSHTRLVRVRVILLIICRASLPGLSMPACP